VFDAPQSWIEKTDASLIHLRGNLTIGRSDSNALVVASPAVSRKHATIHAQDSGEFWLIDLGSANGTFLNGRRVFQPVGLKDGDSIEIADQKMLFRTRVVVAAKTANIPTVPLHNFRSETCWLLVADVVGFTQLSHQLDPELLALSVGSWLRESREIVERNGGVVNKYLGDGYLAFWRGGEELTRRVLAALGDMLVLRREGQLPFRLALHVGPVLFGGGGAMSEESLMGPEVNFVFRLEKIAGGLKWCEALVSEAVYLQIKDFSVCQRLPKKYAVKGFEGEYVLYSFGGLLEPRVVGPEAA
jgi:adenylate cyclase